MRRRPRPRSGVQRDLPAAHIDSFNYAISEGVYQALQVWGSREEGVGRVCACVCGSR